MNSEPAENKSGKYRFGAKELWTGFAVLLPLSVYWMVIGKIQLCIFRLFTGIPCPGCGLTRAGIALLKGDWRTSLEYHPLLGMVLLVLLTALCRKRGIFRKLHECRYFYVAAVILLLLLYVVRMILFFPDGREPMLYEKASLAGKIIQTFF